MGAAGRGESDAPARRRRRDASCGADRTPAAAEQLTPLARDPPSLLPLAFVAVRLLLAPDGANDLARSAVERYSIGPETIAAAATAVREGVALGAVRGSDAGSLHEVRRSAARPSVRSTPGRRLPAAIPSARAQAQLLASTALEVAAAAADGHARRSRPPSPHARRHASAVTASPVATPVWGASPAGASTCASNVARARSSDCEMTRAHCSRPARRADARSDRRCQR